MKLTTTLLLIWISFSMTACGDREKLVLNTEIDKSLLECQDEPTAPVTPVTNRQDAQYKSDLLFMARDCKSKLEKVKAVQMCVAQGTVCKVAGL